MTILEKITSNAMKYPERIMYHLDKGMSEKEEELTWNDLEIFSDKLAAYLDRTLKGNTPVVVYGHKSPYMIVCFLACVKSGRAYCPVDVSVPLNRVEIIIEEVNPEIILSTECLETHYKNVLYLDSICSIIENESGVIEKEKQVQAEDIFYIIFTSGSTGNPKGVQITRDCLDNFVKWARSLDNNRLQKEKHYTFINQAPFSFDLSVMDLYLTLYTGGTLWALDKERQSDMKLLLESLEKSQANVWVSTPSFVDVCLSDKKFSNIILPKLEMFLFCGEILSNRTVNRLQIAFPDSSIINTYGPTESTVAITEISITSEINNKYNPLPIGKEKEGTWVSIVDESGKDVPDGEKGEIVIIGNTVSIGYWKNTERTNKVFGIKDINGKLYRCYHTGDKGYRKDGFLFYCGRIDLQVKLHGYRIEIEDIENNLMKIPYIRQAVVLPNYRGEQVKSIIAYVVTRERVDDSFEYSQKIRFELKQYLPEYMIPKKIVFLEQLPMTNNGKVDRKILGGIKE